jgi:hypothetical protein
VEETVADLRLMRYKPVAKLTKRNSSENNRVNGVEVLQSADIS